MILNLAFSTCPNDTFMFDALVNKRIDISPFEFNVTLADIEELNTMARQNLNNITKISFSAFSELTEQYQMLRSGAAIGFGNGPLIISKRKIYPDELSNARIAIPGEKTTANLLMTILFPDATQKKSYLFSDIEEVVLTDEADAGLIIHETRFSYQDKGLRKVADLGELWEQHKKLPLPLGGIAIQRDLPNDIKLRFQKLLAESVTFALKNPSASTDYVKKHAVDLNVEVMKKHIDLYVNQLSVDCTEKGVQAIEQLLDEASELKNHKLKKPIFLTK